MPCGTVGYSGPEVGVAAVDGRRTPTLRSQRDIGLDAAGDHQVLVRRLRPPMAATVIACCAGSAEAVERHARHGLRPAGEQDGQAADVAVVVAGKDAVAGDDVVDLGRVESDRGSPAPEALREQLLWMDVVQRAVRAALAARRADDVDDPRVDEELLSLRGQR